MGRNWRPLIQGWTWTAVIELALYGFQRFLPPVEVLLRPLYVIALLPGLVGTWRWLRPRGTHDRRAGDRRHAPRRTHEEPPPDR